jgi:large subunit ribosomal protein L18
MATLTVRQARHRRHKRVRGKVFGTPDRPRIVISRSNKGISAQVVDDSKGRTIASAHWLQVQPLHKGNKTDQAAEVGRMLARNARREGVEEVVFDRSGYLYHGRVKALAEALRDGGLKF